MASMHAVMMTRGVTRPHCGTYAVELSAINGLAWQPAKRAPKHADFRHVTLVELVGGINSWLQCPLLHGSHAIVCEAVSHQDREAHTV